MKELFKKMKKPFVYLDSSHAIRSENQQMYKLTRKLSNRNPILFRALLEDLTCASEEDIAYYEQLVFLQNNNIISNVITLEAINPVTVRETAKFIPLFGTLIKPCPNHPEHQMNISDNVVFWEENVNYKTYIKAATILLDASCVVVDKSVLSISVGQALLKHTGKDCDVYILPSEMRKEENGGNHTLYDLPPKQFIQTLFSLQQAIL